jgi:cytochrome P450 family 142 subfamily A polypeptide 1
LFTPRAVASHEQKVRATVRQLLHEVTPRGACDFAQDVAAQLPVIVIGDLMGYPPDDRPVLLRCADQGNLLGTGPGMRYVSRDGIEAIGNFHEATMRLLAERRKAPKDDLISRLAGARLDGDLLDDTEIFNEMLLLNDGGADTTRYVITGGIGALLEHRDQLEAAKNDPSRWPAVVDECLRWVTPIVNMCRTANDDIELAGRKIKKDDWVALLYGAANSDERAFPEPYRFMVNRPNRHVAFGFGTHFCLGAHLARLEVRVMFEELFNRFPDLEISGPPRVSPTAFVRGIDHLPVSLGRARAA